MDKYIYNESNDLWYERCGDYYLPCLALDKGKPVGIWGERYRRYLKEHRRSIYDELLLNGTLDDHVAEIDRQAEEMFDRMIKQIAVKRGITEHLKCEDQTAWVSAMNQIRGISKEVVLTELIYC